MRAWRRRARRRVAAEASAPDLAKVVLARRAARVGEKVEADRALGLENQVLHSRLHLLPRLKAERVQRYSHFLFPSWRLEWRMARKRHSAVNFPRTLQNRIFARLQVYPQCLKRPPMAAIRAMLALAVLQEVLLPAGAFLVGTLSTRSAPGAAARLIAPTQGPSSGARTGVAGLRASLSSALLEGRPAPRWGGELAAEAQACAAVLQVCSVCPAHLRAPPGSCRVLTPLVLRRRPRKCASIFPPR